MTELELIIKYQQFEISNDQTLGNFYLETPNVTGMTLIPYQYILLKHRVTPTSTH